LACLFANKVLPAVQRAGGFLIVAGVSITIIVCAVMPSVNDQPYASTDFVWKRWANSTGYSMDGFVFCLGMLTGAFAVGTPDVVTHMAEEIPDPNINMPKAILAQYVVGFFSSFFYLIALFYGINDLDGVLESRFLFPLAEIYRQCTGSAGGSLGLLILVFLPTFISLIGCYLTASRTFWTLSRDNATPFAPFFAKISPKYKNPFNSIAACAGISTVLGCIYVGSSTAFSAFGAFVGSFVILSTLSYVTTILPHLLSRRKNISPGWFWMKGPVGFVVNAVSSLYILAFIVIYCFPFLLPVDAVSMNYSCLITGGLSVFIALFWFWRQKDYVGPKIVTFDHLAAEVAALETVVPKTF
jgi:choline transport protein